MKKEKLCFKFFLLFVCFFLLNSIFSCKVSSDNVQIEGNGTSGSGTTSDENDDEDNGNEENQNPENPKPDDEDKQIISDSYFWGIWTRMDSGKDYVISETAIIKEEVNYKITSATPDSISSSLGVFKKETNNVMKSDGIPYFRKGGSNIEYNLYVVGFSQNGSDRAASSAVSGVTAVVSSDEYPSYTETVTSSADGRLTLHSPVSGTKNKVKVSDSSGITVTVEVIPQNDGEHAGTVAMTGKNSYSMKVTGEIITDTNADENYLYVGKEYDIQVTIKNVSPDYYSRPGTYRLTSDDGFLTITGTTTEDLPTLNPSATRTVNISVKCKSLSEPYVDTGINFKWCDASGNVWDDFIPLRFFRGKLQVNISAYSTNALNANAALNGFIMYPDGNSKFFSVPHNSKKVLSVPCFKKSDPYKISFSGATNTGKLDETTEMIYGLGVNQNIPIAKNAAETGMSFLELVNNSEPNENENSAYLFSDKIYGYIEGGGDIDFYRFDTSDYGGTGNGSITIPYDNLSQVDPDLNLTITSNACSVTLTAVTGYSSYSWFMDGVKQSVEANTSNTITMDSVSSGYHTFMVVVIDSKGNVYSQTKQVLVNGE